MDLCFGKRWTNANYALANSWIQGNFALEIDGLSRILCFRAFMAILSVNIGISSAKDMTSVGLL